MTQNYQGKNQMLAYVLESRFSAREQMSRDSEVLDHGTQTTTMRMLIDVFRSSIDSARLSRIRQKRAHYKHF